MLQRRPFLLGACAAMMPVPLLAPSPRAQAPRQSIIQPTNVIDALAATGNYDSFIEFARRAGSVELLRGAGPFTLLALNNSAMDRMPISLREQLAPSTGGTGNSAGVDVVRLAAFMNMHIIEGRHTLADLMDSTRALRTRNGNMVEFRSSPGQPMTARIVGDSGFGVGGLNVQLRDAVIAQGEILASNGVVLPINEPLIQ